MNSEDIKDKNLNKRFLFPSVGKTVEAKNIHEATKKLNKENETKKSI